MNLLNTLVVETILKFKVNIRKVWFDQAVLSDYDLTLKTYYHTSFKSWTFQLEK